MKLVRGKQVVRTGVPAEQVALKAKGFKVKPEPVAEKPAEKPEHKTEKK